MTTSPDDSASPVTEPGLTVAAVARRLGVAPATLRTWDRRYGLGPSDHPVGAHRRYSPADVARLDHMRRLVHAGVPPADAARDALTRDLSAGHPAAVTTLASVDQSATDWSATVGEDGDAVPAPLSAAGTVVPLARSAPAAGGLSRAAASLDAHACVRIIDESIRARGVVWTWDRLLVPVLTGVGERWSSTGRGVEVEHVLSQAAVVAFGSLARSPGPPVLPRVVLLAAADEEAHMLPLAATAAALGERRVEARLLGARVPPATLAEAVRRTGPAAVMLWSQQPATGDPGQFTRLPLTRPRPALLAAGPGWPAELPDGVARPHDLADAVSRLSRAAASGR